MIALENLSLRYGRKVIFDQISARINAGERIGLVGSNGAGKTTLLRILCGVEQPDAGEIIRSRWATLGYLPQDGIVHRGSSVYAEVATAFADLLALQDEWEEAQQRLSECEQGSPEAAEWLERAGELQHRLEAADPYRMQSSIEKVLFGLGFSSADLKRDCSEFSGGWQMRIALAKLLLQEPAYLLLDEPTNHLDLDSLRWLENYLQQFRGGLLLISHDRAFFGFNHAKIFALSMGRLEVYVGNYSFYEEESARRKELRLKAAQSQERELAQVERFIDRFRYKASKAAQVQSRIKALDKVERITIEEEESAVSFSFPTPARAGQVVLELQNIHKAYDDLQVLEGVGFRIERGDRIAVVGVNGAGKSTLARIMAGTEPFQSGERIVGYNVEMAHFAQHQADAMEPELTVLEQAERSAGTGFRKSIRSVLGCFLFTGDDVFKPVKVLSGGERNRLALAKMLLRPANLLILDEPTNHLDMRSKGILQQALADYEGTFVIVSHDRAFLDPVVTKVIEVGKKQARVFPGNVSEYLAKIDQDAKLSDSMARSAQSGTGLVNSAPQSDGLSAKERRQQAAALRQKLSPLRKRSEQLQGLILLKEGRVQELETAMTDPAFFKTSDAADATREHLQLKDEIEALYVEWEDCESEIAQLNEL
ncbi:MAG: ABC-F family ATP-binding cassette domain-containing protein [Verrucomicrobia bacterium]|nr:ABC-F family ATP-binding cassette domain-containing protein [Verrucomicrobiota bacterium]